MSASTDAMDEFEELVNRADWRPIETAPKEGDQFVILWCMEDGSRWWAKWQDCRWHGVDELGLTRKGASAGDPNVVTGWFVNAWMPIPDPPFVDREEQSASMREPGGKNG